MLPRTTDVALLQGIDSFLQLLREAGLHNATRQLEDGAVQLQQALEKPSLLIEVAVFESPTPALLAWLSPNVNPDALTKEILRRGAAVEEVWAQVPVVLQVHDAYYPLSVRAGELRPPALVLVVPQNRETADDWTEIAVSLIQDRPAVWVVQEGNEPLPAPLRQEIARQKLLCEEVNLLAVPGKPLAERVADDGFRQLVPMVQASAVAQALESLNQTLGLIVENESRSMKAKRAMLQQELSQSQQGESNSFSDKFGQLKGSLQHQLTMLERSISEKMEQFVRPQVGASWKETENEIEWLTQLKEVQKTKTTVMRIPPEFEEKFFAGIYQRFYQHGLADLISIRDSFKLIQDELEDQTKRLGLPTLPVNFQLMTDKSLKTILDSCVRMDRVYEGEVMRRGLSEYFMAIRKYQMLFFMMASAFGLSFLRNAQWISIPATVVLLGIGAYNLWKTIPKERQEVQEKELAKARESLRSEVKRINSEVSRQWIKEVVDHLRQQINQLLTTAEFSLKEHYQRVSTQDEETRRRLQRQVQGLEATDRQMTNLQRNRENFDRNLLKLKMEIKQVFQQSLRKPFLNKP